MNQNIKNYLGLASAMASAASGLLLGYAVIPETANLVPLTVNLGLAIIAATLAAGVVFVNNLPIERTIKTVTETEEGKVTTTETEKPQQP